MEQATAHAPRTWGPFTGRQLTTMVCVGLVAVAFPVGAFAVTGTNSFVTDAVSGKQATVNATNQLEVHNNGTGVSKLVGSTSTNKAEVTKNNQLLTTEASPSSYFTAVKALSADAVMTVVNPPAGKAMIVKSAVVGTYAGTGLNPYVTIGVSLTSGCVTAAFLPAMYVDVESGLSTTKTVSFDPGLVVPAGGALCVETTDTAADVSASGYSVAASAMSKPTTESSGNVKR